MLALQDDTLSESSPGWSILGCHPVRGGFASPDRPTSQVTPDTGSPCLEPRSWDSSANPRPLWRGSEWRRRSLPGGGLTDRFLTGCRFLLRGGCRLLIDEDYQCLLILSLFSVGWKAEADLHACSRVHGTEGIGLLPDAISSLLCFSRSRLQSDVNRNKKIPSLS
jgi:hypothetical protein